MLIPLAGCGIKIIRPTLKIQMLDYRSETKLDVKILCGTITHLLDPETRIMLGWSFYENQISTLDSGPRFICPSKSSTGVQHRLFVPIQSAYHHFPNFLV